MAAAGMCCMVAAAEELQGCCTSAGSRVVGTPVLTTQAVCGGSRLGEGCCIAPCAACSVLGLIWRDSSRVWQDSCVSREKAFGVCLIMLLENSPLAAAKEAGEHCL